MLHAHIVDRSELKQSFGLNLVLAMAFAAAAAYAYEFAQMPNVAHANAWQADACQTSIKALIDSTPMYELMSGSTMKKIDELCGK